MKANARVEIRKFKNREGWSKFREELRLKVMDRRYRILIFALHAAGP